MELIVTPFPRPETTPPVTIMYFILCLEGRRDGAIVVSHTVVVVTREKTRRERYHERCAKKNGWRADGGG
jgi:hypothetical protein